MQLTELSGSQYATRRKELLALLKQLRATGSEGELKLPRITVIGNQSAGKSSVVEAISGISVPRDAGTCTRCPMECRLSASPGDWSCQISIRRGFDAFGNALDKVSEIPFGDLITKKEDVEPALRRAQIAALNPHISLDVIASQTTDELAEQSYAVTPSLQFSRDTICLDLEGPELTDLAFVDLPGLIQNADPQLVNLVEDVVKSHIKDYGLILVALPMTDDIENQKALRLAWEADPAGHRTIGVMTKPDMLLPSSTKATELWLDVIEGRRHPLAHGYYCTRQPDDSERTSGTTPAQTRESEAAFFSKTAPWSSSTHKDRFGTKHLISTLSTLLVGNIHEILPTISKEAERLLSITNAELAKIPKELSSEPATQMLELLSGFCEDVQRQVVGGLNVGTLVQQNKDGYAAFKRDIRQTAPNFIPFTKPSLSTPGTASGPTDNAKEMARGQVDGRTKAEPYYLDAMRTHIKSSIARELPNNVPFLAKEVLIVRFQEKWESAVEACFGSVYDSTKIAVEWCIENRFKRFGKLAVDVHTHVFQLVAQRSVICTEVLRLLLETERTPYTQNTHYLSDSCAKWMAKYKDVRAGKNNMLEPPAKKRKLSEDISEGQPAASSSPFGGGFFGIAPPAPKTTPQRNGGAAANRGRKSYIEPEDIVGEKETKINNALASLAELGYVGLSTTDLGKLNPTDEYETELRVMSEVRGYFQIAYKRIIDNIPSLIDLMFVKPIGKELQSFLISKFSLGAADANSRCALYLAESPQVTARRKELVAKKERLEAVQRALRDFGLS